LVWNENDPLSYFNYQGWLFSAVPFPAKEMENHNKKKFVTKQIEELLLSGCIREVSLSEIKVVSPLGIVMNSVKKRLILEHGYVKFLHVPKFKYEEICIARDIFMLGDWFFNLIRSQDTTMWASYLPTKNSLVLVGLWLVKRNGLCSRSFHLA